MATSTVLTNKPINPRGDDNRPVDSYNRASLYSGKALDFDGVNDWVDLAGLTFSGNNQSFCFYLKADAWNNFDYIFDIYSNRFIIASQPANNLAIYDGNVWQSFGEIYDTTNTNFFVITIEGTKCRAYLNGIQFGSDLTILARDFSAANECALMAQYDGAQLFFPGSMSGFKAFEVTLTAAQVSDLYNNPEKIVPTGVSNTALKLWLPMMEGAGTTAYDGSGNGNHGTISGATYVNGVGSPVAQTAVIDWNKGTNLFNSSDWEVSNATTNASISSSSQSAPNGIDTAAVFDDGTGSTYKRGYKVSNTGMAIGQITAGTFVKKKDVDYINVVLGTDGGSTKIFALVDLVNGTINATSGSPTATSIQSVGDGWYYVSVQGTQTTTAQGITYIYGQDPTNGSSVDENYTGANNETYIWGINIQEGSINNVHLPTIGALQNSPVLLPQGLTTGRDITGVNLFENVRKQGALNLDGNSWAEVHDNASFDFGTGSFTLEAWAKDEYINTGSAYNVILNLGDVTGTSSTLVSASAYIHFFYGALATSYPTAKDGSWTHIVGTYDGTNSTLYINGVQANQNARTAIDVSNNEVKGIGRDNVATRTYKDQIAQPRIYNRALTASEVLNNYNATKAQFQ